MISQFEYIKGQFFLCEGKGISDLYIGKLLDGLYH